MRNYNATLLLLCSQCVLNTKQQYVCIKFIHFFCLARQHSLVVRKETCRRRDRFQCNSRVGLILQNQFKKGSLQLISFDHAKAPIKSNFKNYLSTHHMNRKWHLNLSVDQFYNNQNFIFCLYYENVIISRILVK